MRAVDAEVFAEREAPRATVEEPGCDRDGLCESSVSSGMRHHAIGERGLDRRRRQSGTGDRGRSLRGIGADIALRGLARGSSEPEMIEASVSRMWCLRVRRSRAAAHGSWRRSCSRTAPSSPARSWRPSAKLLLAGERERLVAAAAVRPRKSLVSWCPVFGAGVR